MIVVERERKGMARKIALIVLLAIFLVAALKVWHPWQREPTVFYPPLILPIEAVDGDIIITENGGRIDIEGNQTITAISYPTEGVTVIKGTKRVTLWELLFGELPK